MGPSAGWFRPSESSFPKYGGDCNALLDSNHSCDGVKVTLREVSEVSEVKDEDTNGPEMAIAQWQLPTPTQSSLNECTYHSAVPDLLDLAATRIEEEEKTDLNKLEINSDIVLEEDDRSSLRRAKNGSVKSFTTDISSEFENLSMPDGSKAEHNGSRRKWHKGFFRLE